MNTQWNWSSIDIKRNKSGMKKDEKQQKKPWKMVLTTDNRSGKLSRIIGTQSKHTKKIVPND